jgi:Ca-activated chloride channel homolog
VVGRHNRAIEEWGDDGLSRRNSGRSRVAVIAIVALGMLAAIGWAAASRDGAREGCGGDAIHIRVAASPDIAPTLDLVAREFAAAGVRIDGRCVAAEVAAKESADMAAVLSGTATGSQPDVWIPDSSTWAARTRTDNRYAIKALDLGLPVATTPVAMAVPRRVAAGWGWPNIEMSWSDFVTGRRKDVGIGLLDPRRASTGLLAVDAVTTAAGTGPDSPAAIAALRRLAPRVFLTSSDQRAALPKSDADRPSGFAMTEQAIAAHNARRPAVALAAVHPAGDALVLDYPYVVVQPATSANALRDQAIGAFRDFLLGDRGQASLRRAGFRGPDGRAEPPLTTDNGTPPVEISPAPPIDAVTAERLISIWSAVSLGTRMLSVLDISGSMGQAVPGTGKTRIQIAVEGMSDVLWAFPGDAFLGLWVFSTDLSKNRDYRELAPIKRLSSTRDRGSHAALVASGLAGVSFKPNGGTALYDTALAAVRAVQAGYDESAVNSIVLLSDGRNDDPRSISLAEFERALRDEAQSSKPVPVFTVAFGPDADTESLARIARLTGGKAYVATNPRDLRAVLADGVAQRACRPNCR